MGKKHGGVFSGYRPTLSSSASSFARRGDPWITEREGRQQFGREVEVENPDADAQRQRLHRLQIKKETQDRLRREVDFKSTMAQLSENPDFDRYFADKVEDRPKPKMPKAKQWPKAGKDFEVDSVHRRIVSIKRKLQSDIRGMTDNRVVGISSSKESINIKARVHEKVVIACPRGCGFSHDDSRMVSRHVRQHSNGCCVHATGCNCSDCRKARNDF